MKRVSLADVAESLGVSKTLVSLVLNGKGDANGISADTQQKVIAKAKELNYKPNQFARGLRLGKSNTIGLIVPDISNSFFARLCRSIEDALAAYDYNLIICSSDEREDKELELIQILVERQVDGLIVASTQKNTSEFAALKKNNFPFVLIDRKFARLQTNSVVVDNKKGAQEAVSHLIQLGNKRIGFLNISPSHLTALKDRLEGYREALKAHGIKFDSKLVREIPFNDIKEAVYEEIKQLLTPPNNVSAIFTANNNLAVAALEALHQMNIRIPQDVAMVSFDDIEVFKLCYPPITAVSQPITNIGEKSIETLMRMVNQKDKTLPLEPQETVLSTSLVVRRSCGAFLHEL